jgi:hypothetical protein
MLAGAFLAAVSGSLDAVLITKFIQGDLNKDPGMEIVAPVGAALLILFFSAGFLWSVRRIIASAGEYFEVDEFGIHQFSRAGAIDLYWEDVSSVRISVKVGFAAGAGAIRMPIERRSRTVLEATVRHPDDLFEAQPALRRALVRGSSNVVQFRLLTGLIAPGFDPEFYATDLQKVLDEVVPEIYRGVELQRSSR